MRKLLFSLLFVLLTFIAEAQITKTNWLVGGSANVYRQQEKLLGTDIKSTSIELSPNLGYFIVDKFAVGLQPSFGYLYYTKSSYHSQSTSWSVGPFARYYFLPVENRTNFFASMAYQYFSSSGGDSHDLLVFSGGPVIFFNSSVGLELTANYKIFKQHNTDNSSKTFFIAIGLQVHLEKDN